MFFSVAKSFQTRYEYINGVQVLSDGNIVVYGTDYADWQYRLTLYTSQVRWILKAELRLQILKIR